MLNDVRVSAAYRLLVATLGFSDTSLILIYSPDRERWCERWVSCPVTQHNEPAYGSTLGCHLTERALKPLVGIAPDLFVLACLDKHSPGESLTQRKERRVDYPVFGWRIRCV